MVNLMPSSDIQLLNALWFYHACLNAVVLHEYWFACIFNDLSVGRSKIIRTLSLRWPRFFNLSVF
jgi:hypothetical protein